MTFLVEDIATRTKIGTLPLGLSFLRWHPTEPLIRFIFEGNDWEVDPYNPDRQNWKRITPVKLSGGWSKNEIAQTADDTILTWGKTCNRCGSNMWLVSQDGLEAEQIAEGTNETVYWVFDENDAPVLRVDSLDAAHQRVFRKDGDVWNTLFDVNLNDAFYPLGQVRGDNTVLVTSSRGRDTTAMVSLDVKTGEETVVISTQGADLGWTNDITLDGQPDFIRLRTDTGERRALTDAGQVYLDILATFPQPVALGATNPTAGGMWCSRSHRRTNPMSPS